MKAYVLVDVNITDLARYDDYKKLTLATIEQFDGKFLVRGGVVEILEGDWNPDRLVILEFPSVAQAKAWWSSEAYAPAKTIRQLACVTRMIVAEGLS